MGPLVTLRDLLNCFPYDDTLTRYVISGVKLKKIFSHIMRTENRDSEGECYQVNSVVKAVYNDNHHELESLKINGNVASNTEFYSVCLQGYHFNNAASYLSISQEELLESEKTKVISTSVQEVLEEFLRNHQNIKRRVEGRLVYQ
jgi:5'-nucleotidase